MNNPFHPQLGSSRNDADSQLYQRFQSRFRESESVSVETFLAEETVGPVSESQLVNLIQCEIELRRQQGEVPGSSEYARRFPELDAELLEDLVSLPSPPIESSSGPLLPGRYEVISLLGEGGIGSVWRVLDRQMNRPLAAKVLLRRFRFDPAAGARLMREAMLMGSLQHPGIPPVYESGELLSGSPFFTMKVVEGQTLAEMLKSRSSPTDSSLQYLGIFEQIAQTMAYAHAQGIVHRDLKPHNIMVGRFGEVQLMDWGIAAQISDSEPSVAAESASDRVPNATRVDPVSTTDSASHIVDPLHSLTREGDVLGTPCYMSPEQARGDPSIAGPRSDVFSLGAMLYEILMGTRLYATVPHSELLKASANRELAQELERLEHSDWDEKLIQLCLDCLENEPQSRPSGGEQVARRMSEYLASVAERLKAVELQKASAELKAEEERKRRNMVGWMASLVAIVSLAGVLGVGWQWSQAVKASRMASAETERARANFEKLLESVEQMLTRVGDEKLADVPHMKTIRRELLEEALMFYQQIVAQEGDAPELRFEVAEAHRLMSKIQYLLGEDAEAMKHLDEAISVYKDLEGTISGTRLALPMAFCHESIGRIESRRGNLAQSEEAYLLGIDLRRQLVADEPDQLQRRIQLADSLRGLGTVRKKQEDLLGAEEVLQSAIDLTESLVADDPNFAEASKALASALHSLGQVYDRRKDLDAARDYFQRATEVLAPQVDDNAQATEEDRAELSTYLNNLATVYRERGETELAEAGHLRAIELRRQLVSDYPSTPRYRSLLASSCTNLGVIYKLGDTPQDCKPLYDEAVELFRGLARDFPDVPEYRTSLVITLHNLANFREATERGEMAVELRNQAAEAGRQLVSDYSHTPHYRFVLGTVLNDLALQLERRGRTLPALSAIDESLQLREPLAEEFSDNPRFTMTLALSQGLKAWILAMAPDSQLRDVPTALRLSQQAIDIDPNDVKHLRSRGAALFRNGDYEQAVQQLMLIKPDENEDLGTWYLLAMAYLKQGDKLEAEAWLARAEELRETSSKFPDVNLDPIREEAIELIGDSN